MFDKFYHYSHREKGLWRGWLNYDHDEGWRARWEAKLEVPWGKGNLLGFRLHFGDRGSETPVDFSIGFYWFAFYFSLNTPRLYRFCEWIGRGHKRDLSLKFFNKALWWKLWYCDDGGYDQYHKCDPWRRPKLWPWSCGRSKYRGWMCLRDGRIDLNPLDAIWGTPKYTYVVLDEDELLMEIDQFPGDEYMLRVKFEQAWRGRKHGPSWVRRKKLMHHEVAWSSYEDGVPVQNHDWKGDVVLESSIRVGDLDYWRMEFDVKFKDWVREQRKKNRYRPPSHKRQIIHLEEMYPGDLQSMAAKGEIPHFEETYSGNLESKCEIIRLNEDELDDDLENDDPLPRWKTQPRDARGRFIKIEDELKHSAPFDVYYLDGRMDYNMFKALDNRD